MPPPPCPDACTWEDGIGRHFDARAAHYDNPLTTFIGERKLRLVRRLVPARSQVLDYGCGTGRTALDHLRRGCNLTAYDISAPMLAIAEAKAQDLGLKAEFTVDPASLAGRRWPVVTCIGVLDYYLDPLPMLKRLRAYLPPEGCLIVTCPNALSPLAWIYVTLSRFTIPAAAHSPQIMWRAAARAGLVVFNLGYAFPELRPVGHTLVLGLHPARE